MLKQTLEILTVNMPFIQAVLIPAGALGQGNESWPVSARFPSQQSVQICWTPTDVNKNVEQNHWYLLQPFKGEEQHYIHREKQLKEQFYKAVIVLTKQRLSIIIEADLVSAIKSLT